MELLVADDIDINLKIHTGWAAVDKDEFIFEESWRSKQKDQIIIYNPSCPRKKHASCSR